MTESRDMTPASTPPEGSIIQTRDDFDGTTYWWRPPKVGVMRYGIAAFMGLWLCGWAVGWVSAAGQILRGGGLRNGQGIAGVFLYVWMAGWTVGGAFAIWMMTTLLRPFRPESITLSHDALTHDPGHFLIMMASPNTQAYTSTMTPGAAFRRRKPITVPRESLKPVLDRVGERQRLTFDHGADRVEIGATLREPEREWLYLTIESWRHG